MENTGELFQEYFVAHGGLKEFCRINSGANFDSLSKEEIHHLIWLLVEELNSREAKIKEGN